jgi:hypothetical protein
VAFSVVCLPAQWAGAPSALDHVVDRALEMIEGTEPYKTRLRERDEAFDKLTGDKVSSARSAIDGIYDMAQSCTLGKDDQLQRLFEVYRKATDPELEFKDNGRCMRFMAVCAELGVAPQISADEVHKHLFAEACCSVGAGYPELLRDWTPQQKDEVAGKILSMRRVTHAVITELIEKLPPRTFITLPQWMASSAQYLIISHLRELWKLLGPFNYINNIHNNALGISYQTTKYDLPSLQEIWGIGLRLIQMCPSVRVTIMVFPSNPGPAQMMQEREICTLWANARPTSHRAIGSGGCLAPIVEDVRRAYCEQGPMIPGYERAPIDLQDLINLRGGFVKIRYFDDRFLTDIINAMDGVTASRFLYWCDSNKQCVFMRHTEDAVSVVYGAQDAVLLAKGDESDVRKFRNGRLV